MSGSEHDRAPIRERVRQIVAEALDRNPEEVTPQASLIDDLGAESIDFLDIRYRVETEFGIKTEGDEIWRGRWFDRRQEFLDEHGLSPQGMAYLRTEMPDFDWGRFPRAVTREDLPRLITVDTIVAFLAGQEEHPV